MGGVAIKVLPPRTEDQERGRRRTGWVTEGPSGEEIP